VTHGRTILIVDDEAPIRAVLRRWLTGWGYGVGEAAHASEALELMSAAPADIILCDVAMPDRDGLWLVEQVRTRWPATAIVMATGRDDPDTVLASRKLGAVAYVVKPFNSIMLHDALETASAQLPGR
jgi:CheY-like chemotaxis protein